MSRKFEQIESVLLSNGPMFYGTPGEVSGIAKLWYTLGFTAERVDAWCKVGCWNPRIAKKFRSSYMGADQAKRACDDYDGMYGGDVMYVLCAGAESFTINDVIEAYKNS
jgi:hypothetical protein